MKKPSHPDLLVAMADDFTKSGYDLKGLLRAVCNSKSYQRSSRPLPENRDDETLYKLIKGRIPQQTMPKTWANTPDEQIWKMLAYVRSLYKGDPSLITWGVSPPPDAADATVAPGRGPGRLGACYDDEPQGRTVCYRVRRLWAGLGVSFLAGGLSGLLGIGGGTFKVPARCTPYDDVTRPLRGEDVLLFRVLRCSD